MRSPASPSITSSHGTRDFNNAGSYDRAIKMDAARLAGYRNFATKLWNAARCCEANGIAASTSLEGPAASLPVNRWIIGEVADTVAAMETAFAAYRYDDAANAVYSFAWDRFCDWYLELIKGAIDDETKTVAGWVLDQILVMLHPFMPFITEELWTGLGDRSEEHTSELQSLMRISYAVFCLKKK